MGCSVHVERVGADGISEGVATFHEVGGESKALAIATDAGDVHPCEPQHIAPVFDDFGHLIPAPAGRRMDGVEAKLGDAGR